MIKRFIIFIFATTGSMHAMQLDMRLIKAAEQGDIDQVQHLLDAGVPVNQADEFDQTALMCAADKGHELIVRLLLAAGESVNHASEKGLTALMCAAISGHEPIVRLLLGAGASVNKADNDNWTALMFAGWIGGREPTCHLLIERMLKIPSDSQRLKIYNALICLKRLGLGRDLRGYMKPFFLNIIEPDNRENFQDSVAKREIDKIPNEDIKQRLLDRYNQHAAAQSSFGLLTWNAFFAKMWEYVLMIE